MSVLYMIIFKRDRGKEEEEASPTGLRRWAAWIQGVSKNSERRVYLPGEWRTYFYLENTTRCQKK